MPTFTYTPLTATSYRVTDAHTGEEYGVVTRTDGLWYVKGESYRRGYGVRDDAAQALYRTRTAFGFECGVL